ncbi:MAG: hypothetical protein ACN4GT_09510 [Gammaproteobacteria bacterium]
MQRRSLISYLGALLVVGAAGLVTTADARMGRPMSPGSMGGVHRRHRRRRRRRRRRIAIGMTVSTLPETCAIQTRDGVEYHYCDGVWYRPQYQGTEVVYVVDDIDEGTEAYTDE